MLLIETKGNSLIYPLFIKLNEKKYLKVATAFELIINGENYIVLILKMFKNPYLLHSSGFSPILMLFWRKTNGKFEFEFAESNFNKPGEQTDEYGIMAKDFKDHVMNNKMHIELVTNLYYNLFLLPHFNKNNIIADHDFELIKFEYDANIMRDYVQDFARDKLFYNEFPE
jgi:hypothetical protein